MACENQHVHFEVYTNISEARSLITRGVMKKIAKRKGLNRFASGGVKLRSRRRVHRSIFLMSMEDGLDSGLVRQQSKSSLHKLFDIVSAEGLEG